MLSLVGVGGVTGGGLGVIGWASGVGGGFGGVGGVTGGWLGVTGGGLGGVGGEYPQQSAPKQQEFFPLLARTAGHARSQ